MSAPYEILGDPAAPVLLVVDHASNHVPDDIDLGVPEALLREHIAYDIGVAQVARLLVAKGNCCAILGGVSRLVIDFNRQPDADGLVPLHSDGHLIAGNQTVEVTERLERYFEPYHGQVARLAGQGHAPFLLSLHSFTPRLRSRPEELRPWEAGVLYNQDDRGARMILPLLEAAGLVVGDQLPYSGKLLNATMDRHAEAHDRPYVTLELRQDLIADAAGQGRLADILGPILHQCRNALA